MSAEEKISLCSQSWRGFVLLRWSTGCISPSTAISTGCICYFSARMQCPIEEQCALYTTSQWEQAPFQGRQRCSCCSPRAASAPSSEQHPAANCRCTLKEPSSSWVLWQHTSSQTYIYHCFHLLSQKCFMNRNGNWWLKNSAYSCRKKGSVKFCPSSTRQFCLASMETTCLRFASICFSPGFVWPRSHQMLSNQSVFAAQMPCFLLETPCPAQWGCGSCSASGWGQWQSGAKGSLRGWTVSQRSVGGFSLVALQLFYFLSNLSEEWVSCFECAFLGQWFWPDENAGMVQENQGNSDSLPSVLFKKASFLPLLDVIVMSSI